MLRLDALSPVLVIESLQERSVAPAEVQSQVDMIWLSEQTRRSQPMHDGGLFSLETRAEACWTGAFVPYRWFVAQLRAPELFEVLRVRPVAVSGVLSGPDGVVFGRRSAGGAQFPGWWELAPSGGLDRACRRADGTIDYIGKVVEELVEETGCPAARLTRIRPFAAVEDTTTRSVDIGVELSTDLTRAELERHAQANASGEYDTIEIVPREDIADFVRRCEGEVVEVSCALLVELGFLRAG